MTCYCRTENHIHSFQCFLRAIAKDYIPGRNQYGTW